MSLTKPDETPSTAAVKVAAIEGVSENLQEFVKQFGGIIQKLLEVAKSNPLVGLFLCIIMTDILQKNKIIYDDTASTLRGGLYALGGLSIAGGVVSLLQSFIGGDAHVQLLKTSLVTDAHSEGSAGGKIIEMEKTDGYEQQKQLSDQMQKILPLLTQLAATAA